ncbi:MAG: PH domain-containing protein [Bacteroidota bacterium]
MAKAETLVQAEFDRKLIFYLFAFGAGALFISVIGILVLPFWLLGIGMYYARRYFNHLEAELTTRALRFKKGIMFQVEKTIPLDNITDLTFKTGPLLRMFGLSTLQIETAGQSSGEGSNMTLMGIVDAEEFRNAVLEQRDTLTDRTEPGAAAPADDLPSEFQREVLQILREINAKLDGI